MKLNDWIIANLNNPDFTVEDFQYLADLTLENTLLLAKNLYLSNPYINEHPKFKGEDGMFSPDKFSDFYDLTTRSFQEFSELDDINTLKYDMFDINRVKDENAKVKDVNFQIGLRSNPKLISIGIEGLNEITYSGKSIRELALNSKIYDTGSGKFLDKSVNDLSLTSDPVEYFKSLLGDPLVYATYDEDTEEIDPTTGNKILHKKGEYKINDNGEYYVETLNGRSLHGKLVVSGFDYLTPENSSFNNYDFFDSDGLDKSAIGITLKNIVAAVPVFIPGVNTVYGSLIVARELAKTGPMLYGMINTFSGNEDINSLFLNTVAGYASKFSTSTSDYALSNLFSYENIANLASDVVMQWNLMETIVKGFNKLSGGGKKAIDGAYAKAKAEYISRAKLLRKDTPDDKLFAQKSKLFLGTSNYNTITKDMVESGQWVNSNYGLAALSKHLQKALDIAAQRQRIGLDLALGYMALISNTDVYESVLAKGGSPMAAASIALGSIAGMYSVDKYLGLGELFSDDDLARAAFRNGTRREVDNLVKTSGAITNSNEISKKGIVGLILKGTTLGRNAVKNYKYKLKNKELGLAGKALGEALEETAEELVTDLSKYTGEIVSRLGGNLESDYGAFENIFERYAMSFLGGGLGGGLYGVKLKLSRHESQEFQDNMIYLIRNYGKDKVLVELEKLKKLDPSRFGSRTLSFDKTEDGKAFLTADENHKSLADYIYETMVKTINLLELLLNGSKTNISEDELFDYMVLGEYKAQALTDFLKGDVESVKNISYISRFQEDFLKLTNKILKKETGILKLNEIDPNTRNEKFQEDLAKLIEERDALLEEKEYLFGEGSLGYVEKTLFAIDPRLSGKLIPLNYNLFARRLYGKSLSKLTEGEKEHLSKQFKLYKSTVKQDLDTVFKDFRLLLDLTKSEVLKLKGISKESHEKAILKDRKLYPKNHLLDYDSKLDDESEDDYKNRNIKLATETDDQFNDRREKRKKKIKTIRESSIGKLVKEFSEGFIDRSTYRQFVAWSQLLSKNLIQLLVDKFFKEFEKEFKIDTETEEGLWFAKILTPEVLNKIKYLLSIGNIGDETLRENIIDSIEDEILDSVKKQYKGLYDNSLWGNRISNTDFATFDDFYNFAFTTIQNQKAEGDEEFNISSLIEILEQSGWVFDSSAQGKLNLEAIKYAVEKLAGMNPDGGDTVLEINDVYIRKISDSLLNKMRSIINSYIFDQIDNDELTQSLLTLEKTPYKSFIIPLLSSIQSKLRGDTDIESFLEQVYLQFVGGISTFELTDQQINILNEVLSNLNVLESILYAAARTGDFDFLIEHNKQINDFVKNHPGIFKNFKDLAVLDEGDVPMILDEIAQYRNEVNDWLKAHYDNTISKSEQHIKTDLALVKARLEFYENNRGAFKVTEDIDLLEGYELLEKSDDIISLVKVEELLHLNYKKALSNNINNKLIFEAIIPKITDKDELALQTTAKLDETLTYDKLTSYDKYAIVISNLSASSISFYSNLKEFIDKNKEIAPLAILEFAAKLIQSQTLNLELINESLEYIKEYTRSELAILPNTSILLGVAGAGKTKATGKMIIGNGENSWISGPTNHQLEVLQKEYSKAIPKTIDELLELALGSNYSTITLTAVTKLDSNTELINSTYWEAVKSPIGDSGLVLKNDVAINKVTDPPKYIVIDEASHIPSSKLLIISKFCNKNNILLILLGDDTLNGYLKPKVEYSLEPKSVIAWRTPKLSISLRENNLLKIINLRTLLTILEACEHATTDNEVMTLGKKLLENEFANLSLQYYNEDEFYGELITDTLSDELINKIKNSKVGFIGLESSNYCEQLKNAGIVPDVVDATLVQGREYDYVIVDREWKCKVDLNDPKESATNIYVFIKDLYTMISRSKNGTILIDKGLSELVKNERRTVPGISKPIASAVTSFRELRLSLIEGILLLEDLFKDTTPETTPKTDSTTLNPHNDSDKEDEDKNLENKGKTVSDKPPLTEELLKEVEDILDVDKSPEKIIDPSILEEIDTTDSETVTINTSDISKKVDISNTPIRVYGNVHLSGVKYSKNGVTNEEDSRLDLGIFIRPGETIKKDRDLNTIVKNLLDIKSFILYDVLKSVNKNNTTYYDKLDILTRRLFSIDALLNPEYFIKVSNPSESNHLIGMTDFGENGLKLDKLLIEGKVITLIAKIKGKDGNTYSVTLGGLANPDTWRKNYEDGNVVDPILKKINNNDPESEKLKLYLENLPKYIDSYEEYIKEISTQELEISIDKPDLSQMTTLIKAGKLLRLEDINTSFSPFEDACRYAVKSPVYVVTKKIPGVDNSVVGKAVMYVSNNTLLSPNLLEQMYLHLKNNPDTSNPWVRMIVLNNEGVSFESLRREKYKDIYTTVTKNGVRYTSPLHAETTAIGMYVSLWNFRANLKNFLDVYTEWRDSEGLTDDEVDELCKLDNDLYVKARGDSKYLDEETYRNSVSPEMRQRVKRIWDFNDSLSESVRLFRLGYSSENGVYLRKLTNLKEGGFYKYPNDTIGMYINISLANQYDQVLDTLFTEVIDKVIKLNEGIYGPKDLLNINKVDRWYQEGVKLNRNISFTIVDTSKKADDHLSYPVVTELTLPGSESDVSRLETLLIQVTKFMEIRGFNPETFDNWRLDKHLSGKLDKFDIKVGDESIKYTLIADGLNGGLLQTSHIQESNNLNVNEPGVVIMDLADGPYIIDKRIDNLFSLAFHGVTSTSRENDFETSDIRATDAYFKYGFKVHPTLINVVNNKKYINAPVATNVKLFSSDVVPGFPLMTIKVKKGVIDEVKEKVNEEMLLTDANDYLIKSISESFQLMGFTISEKTLNDWRTETKDSIINWVKTKIPDILSQGLNYGRFGNVINPANIIIDIDERGNLITLSSKSELFGIKLLLYNPEGEFYYAETENKTVTVSLFIDNNLIITEKPLVEKSPAEKVEESFELLNEGTSEQKVESSDNLTYNLILDSIFTELSKLKGYTDLDLDDNLVELYTDEKAEDLKTSIKGKLGIEDENTILVQDNIAVIVNTVQEALTLIADNTENEEFKNETSLISLKLTNTYLKNGCKI